MIFRESKCAYICIARGKRKSVGSSIVMNELMVQELKEEEQYKYLGQDESVGYCGPANKKSVIKEYEKSEKDLEFGTLWE